MTKTNETVDYIANNKTNQTIFRLWRKRLLADAADFGAGYFADRKVSRMLRGALESANSARKYDAAELRPLYERARYIAIQTALTVEGAYKCIKPGGLTLDDIIENTIDTINMNIGIWFK